MAKTLTPSDQPEFASIFAALGDKTRLSLISRLSSEGPGSISELSDAAPISRQAITKHLNVLLDVGLVADGWRGRERVWEFSPSRLTEASTYLEHISQKWDETLQRLKDFVEE